MVQRVNGDLANDLGNLSQRVLSMIFKIVLGGCPLCRTRSSDQDQALLDATDALLYVRHPIDRQAFRDALRDIWQVIADANRYVDAAALGRCVKPTLIA